MYEDVYNLKIGNNLVNLDISNNLLSSLDKNLIINHFQMGSY